MKKKELTNYLVYSFLPLASHLGNIPYASKLMQKCYYLLSNGPKSVKIHINNECNFNCIYCYSTNNKIDSLKTEDWLNVLDKLSKFNVQTIEVSGGEPTLNKDLHKILKKCEEKNFRVTIYTNGSKITKDFIKKIKSLKIQVIISIKYSFKNDYKKLTRSKFDIDNIEKNMNLLAKNNIPVAAFITVTSSNISKLSSIINKSIKLGGFPIIERYMPLKDNNINKSLCITRKDWDSALRMIAKVYENYKTLISGVNNIQGSTCSCFRTHFTIMQNGDILPCQFMPLDFKIGNIKTERIEEIWGKFSKHRKKWIKKPSECKKCKNIDICGGGCRTHAYYKEKNFLSKDPLCTLNLPTTYGHCAFTVIHSMKKNVNNNKLNNLKKDLT